jgi:hypothetical protein
LVLDNQQEQQVEAADDICSFDAEKALMTKLRRDIVMELIKGTVSDQAGEVAQNRVQDGDGTHRHTIFPIHVTK